MEKVEYGGKIASVRAQKVCVVDRLTLPCACISVIEVHRMPVSHGSKNLKAFVTLAVRRKA